MDASSIEQFIQSIPETLNNEQLSSLLSTLEQMKVQDCHIPNLLVLHEQLKQWQKAQHDLLTIADLNKQLLLTEEHSRKTRTTYESYKQESATQQSWLETHFTPIYDAYFKTQVKENSLAAQFCPQTLDEMRMLIEDYLINLGRQRDHLNEQNAYLRVHQNYQDIVCIRRQLDELEYRFDSDAPKALQNCQQTRQRLLGFEKQLMPLLPQLQQYLSSDDLDHIRNGLEKKLLLNHQKRSKIEEKLRKHSLDQSQQATWIKAIDESQDQLQFIQEQLQQRQLALSYLNPVTILRWGVSFIVAYDFQQDQAGLRLEADLLGCLQQKYEILREHEELQAKIGHANPDHLMLTAPCQEEPSILLEQANSLLSQLLIENWQPQSSLFDASFHIKMQLAVLQKKIQTLDQVIEALEKLSRLEKSNYEIRHSNNILISPSALLTIEQAQALEKTSPSRIQELDFLKQQLDLCQQWLEERQKYDKANQCQGQMHRGHQSFKQQASQIKWQLQSLKSAEALSQEISGFEAQIRKQVMLLKQQAVNSPAGPTVTQHNPYEEYIIACEHYHEQIALLTYQVSPDLKQWYQKLKESMSPLAEQTQEWFKRMQLLRDILFELQYPDANQHFQTLQHYQRLAPNPIKESQNLLAIKPPCSVAVPPSNTPRPIPIQKQILEIRGKIISLNQRGHEKEAHLLEQAIDNLERLSMHPDKHMASEALFQLLDDPRYHPLKQHRGIGKALAYFAQACADVLNWLQPEAHWQARQLFFYHQTASSALLDKTATALRTTQLA